MSRIGQKASEFIEAVPAPLLMLIAVAMLASSAGFAKTLVTMDTIAAIAFLRLALGAVVLFVVLRPRLKGHSPRALLEAAALGLVIAVFEYVGLWALIAMPLGITVTLSFLGPLAISLADARRPAEFAFPILGFLGVALLTPVGPDSAITWGALAIGLATAGLWALYIITSTRTGKQFPGIEGFVLANLFAAAFIAPFGVAGALPLIVDPVMLAAIFGATLLAIIPLGLEFLALKRLSPNVFGVLLSLEPALASLIGFVALGERLGMLGWLAVALVTLSSIGATLSRKRDQAVEG